MQNKNENLYLAKLYLHIVLNWEYSEWSCLLNATALFINKDTHTAIQRGLARYMSNYVTIFGTVLEIWSI